MAAGRLLITRGDRYAHMIEVAAVSNVRQCLTGPFLYGPGVMSVQAAVNRSDNSDDFLR